MGAGRQEVPLRQNSFSDGQYVSRSCHVIVGNSTWFYITSLLLLLLLLFDMLTHMHKGHV